VIEQGKTGLLSPPKNPFKLKSAIAELIENPQLRETIATKGKQTVQTYDWSYISDKFITLYQNAKTTT
jgi:glycosyltransferase involved in cell wall biosynthesis